MFAQHMSSSAQSGNTYVPLWALKQWHAGAKALRISMLWDQSQVNAAQDQHYLKPFELSAAQMHSAIMSGPAAAQWGLVSGIS